MVVPANNHYCDEFIIKCTPFFLQGFDAIYINTMEKCNKKRMILRHFQDTLESIPLWNSRIIATEHQRFVNTSNCTWLDDLIKAAFLELANNIVNDHDLEIDVSLEIPNGIDFIHSCYINIARELWKKPQLLYHDFDAVTKIRNREDFEKLVEKMLHETFKKHLPMERILSTYLNDKSQTAGAENTESDDAKNAVSDDDAVVVVSDTVYQEPVIDETQSAERDEVAEHDESVDAAVGGEETCPNVDETIDSQSAHEEEELKQIDTDNFPKLLKNDRSETSIVKLGGDHDITDSTTNLEEEDKEEENENENEGETAQDTARVPDSAIEADDVSSVENDNVADEETNVIPNEHEVIPIDYSQDKSKVEGNFFEKLLHKFPLVSVEKETVVAVHEKTDATESSSLEESPVVAIEPVKEDVAPVILESEEELPNTDVEDVAVTVEEPAMNSTEPMKSEEFPVVEKAVFEAAANDTEDPPFVRLSIHDLKKNEQNELDVTEDDTPAPSSDDTPTEVQEPEDFDVEILSDNDNIVLSKVSKKKRSNQHKITNILGPGITVKDFKNPKTRNRIKKYLLLKNTLF